MTGEDFMDTRRHTDGWTLECNMVHVLLHYTACSIVDRSPLSTENVSNVYERLRAQPNVSGVHLFIVIKVVFY